MPSARNINILVYLSSLTQIGSEVENWSFSSQQFPSTFMVMAIISAAEKKGKKGRWAAPSPALTSAESEHFCKIKIR